MAFVICGLAAGLAGVTIVVNWIGGMDSAVQPLEGVVCLVSVYGLYDFTWLGGALARWMRKLVLRTRDPATWRAQSPIEQCDVPVPLLLIHGTADLLVPLEQCERLAGRREELGLETATRVYPDQPHGFLNDARRDATEEAVAEILGFLGSWPDSWPRTPDAATGLTERPRNL